MLWLLFHVLCIVLLVSGIPTIQRKRAASFERSVVSRQYEGGELADLYLLAVFIGILINVGLIVSTVVERSGGSLL